MKRMQTWRWMVVGLLAMGQMAARGEDLRIQSLDGSGRLTFNTLTDGTNYNYRVEWAPTPSGPWTNSWDALAAIQATGSGIVTCSVPMCYRVVALVNPLGMVLIPAGTNSGTDPDFGAYSLTVSAFYMDQTEVTKAQWDNVYTWAITNGYSFANVGSSKAANHPVHSVTWHDCVKWCNARSEKEGRPVCYRVAGEVYRGVDDNAVACDMNVAGYRLPTGGEWQYAARGGLSGKRFPWGDTIDHTRANYYGYPSGSAYDTGYQGYDTRFFVGDVPYTSPVESFPANGYGLHDMAGNVFEWCWDWFPGSMEQDRMFRGGGWNFPSEFSRTAFLVDPWLPRTDIYLGFRTVLPLGQP